jgi:hypothetical protein
VTREKWLTRAGVELSEMIHENTDKIVTEYRVSCGFSEWGPECDGATYFDTNDGIPQIFIVPTIEDTEYALTVLLHELVHVAVGKHFDHDKDFALTAASVGLIAPFEESNAGSLLRPKLKKLIKHLGKYPHSAVKITVG